MGKVDYFNIALGCSNRLDACAALSLGYASHLVGDACTRGGIPLFYPNRRSYRLLLRKIRVVTGSEYYVDVLFAAFALVSMVLL
jgi:membrane-bound metal-dependent hydrolase YbcI (DUF457 family)